jgi:hypothetical protein
MMTRELAASGASSTRTAIAGQPEPEPFRCSYRRWPLFNEEQHDDRIDRHLDRLPCAR